MKLKNSQVEFIISDLKARGLVYQPLQDEIVDHICSMIEQEMDQGMRFREAYHKSLRLFGKNDELDEIQKLTINNNFLTTKIMIRNYFKTAIRNLKKNRFYSFINVAGLSIGIACAILITLFIIDELSYDRFNQNGDRIYRVLTHLKFGGNDSWYAVCPAPMAKTMVEEIPEIEVAARFRQWGPFLVKKDKDNIKEHDAIWADPEILKIFSLPFIKGNPQEALKEPNTIVISESFARKIFGDTDPLGQTLVLDNFMNCKIAGIFRDLPHNSHFHFNLMVAMAGLDESKNDMWLSNNFQTYFLMQKGADLAVVEKKINDMMIKHAGPQVMQFMGKSIEEMLKQGTKLEEIPVPLYDIHLRSHVLAELENNGDIKYIYIFSAIALFILILAIINFMNLSTARSADRAREVGIRKVMGSYRSYIINQFLTESILLTFISLLLSLLLAALAMPYFNHLSGKSLALPLESILFWILLIAGGLLIGILSGSYPAFFLSSFRPSSILAGKLAKGSRSSLVRSALVIFQFTVSIILIIGTIAIYNQLNFIQHQRIGFNKDQVISLNDTQVLGKQSEPFKNEILKNPDFISGTISGFLPVENSSRSSTTFWKKGERTPDNSVMMQYWRVDYDYIKTLGMKIVKGRDFSRDFPSDTSGIILNERAARLFGFADPVGSEIQVFGDSDNGSIEESNVLTFRVIGVVQDFNWESLHENIGALCMRLGSGGDKISFRFRAANTEKIILALKGKWSEMAPGQPFEYSFLDDDFGNMYASEKLTGKIFTTFAVIAVVIACLGLFALASFMAEQRTKEIGVRKVMGATSGNIVLLLSKDFTRLVLISFLLSVPLAWYGIKIWLEGFAYKDVPGIIVYVSAGIGSLVIAWLTVSYQSFRAASTNPADALRDE